MIIIPFLRKQDQNYLHNQVCCLSPETIIEMATLNGAKALKWKTGQLSPGFLADLIMIDTRKVHLRPLITKPVSNVMFNVVYYAMGFDVDTVVIDGRVIMREKKLLTIDESEILSIRYDTYILQFKLLNILIMNT